MKIKLHNTIESLAADFGWTRPGHLFENDLDVINNETEINGRVRKDAEVMALVAANIDGPVLDVGTSFGRSAYRFATNLHFKYPVYTVNILPDQYAGDTEMITHLLKREDIGSYYRSKNLPDDAIIQFYADTLSWLPPREIDNLSLAFIDGAHDTKAVISDSLLAWERLSQNGIIMWHDFNPDLIQNYDWINSCMDGVLNFLKIKELGEVVIHHVRNSWIGILDKSTTKIRTSKNAAEIFAQQIQKNGKILIVGNAGFNIAYTLKNRGFTSIMVMVKNKNDILQLNHIVSFVDDPMAPKRIPKYKFSAIILTENNIYENVVQTYIKYLESDGLIFALNNPSPSVEEDISLTRLSLDLPANGIALQQTSPARFSINSVEGKLPRIAIIIDVHGWIFARHALEIKRRLSHRYDFTIRTVAEGYNEDDFDIIYFLEWNLLKGYKQKNKYKYIAGIRSYLSWENLDFFEVLTQLNDRFLLTHCVSKKLLSIFSPFLPTVRYVAHGVDTQFFTTQSTQQKKISTDEPLRVGWAGNKNSAENKGYYDILKPLSELSWLVVVTCGYGDKHLTRFEMRKFYDNIDVYICASANEGSNNSLLEAASMGKAIVTTDNGSVPEYLRNGVSAYIVERHFPLFVLALKNLKENAKLRESMGATARESVRSLFDWSIKIKEYAAFFDEALSIGAV